MADSNSNEFALLGACAGTFARATAQREPESAALGEERVRGILPERPSPGRKHATGRKKLIMAGIATEVCLAQSVLAALDDGFEVYFVSDCSTGVTQEAHDDAKVRMTAEGARPINWLAVISEWTPEVTSPERAAIVDALSQRGGASSLWIDYVFAKVKSGVVPAPEFSAQSG